MATKTKTTVSSLDLIPIYHDFEPYCEWKRGEDLLIVHVPEFKKEHLRVQVNTSGILKISGEKTLEGDKTATRSRFYKETRVPEGCNINDIHSKLSDGKLTIVMPRNHLNIILPGVQPPSTSEPSTQPLVPGKKTSEQDQRALIKEKPGTSDTDQRKPGCSILDSVRGKCRLNEREDEMIGFGGFKVAKKIVVNVGIAVVAIAAIGALVFLKPQTSAASPSSTAIAKKKE